MLLPKKLSLLLLTLIHPPPKSFFKCLAAVQAIIHSPVLGQFSLNFVSRRQASLRRRRLRFSRWLLFQILISTSLKIWLLFLIKIFSSPSRILSRQVVNFLLLSEVKNFLPCSLFFHQLGSSQPKRQQSLHRKSRRLFLPKSTPPWTSVKKIATKSTPFLFGRV